MSGRTSGLVIAKSISIKGLECRSGGCAPKAVELTPGDLPGVLETGLMKPQGDLIVGQKSAEGIVRGQPRKARTSGSGK